MPHLIKKIQNTAFQNDLFQKGSKILVAVSGGPDSVCLLDILYKLKKKYSFDLSVAHVNYNLRGKDSDKDEKLVKKLAEKYIIPIKILNPHPPFGHLLPKKEEGKLQISENTLREIRYDFFEETRKKIKFDFIAVAHNLDDQVETFLMRLIRGSGLNGLSSMKFRNGKIIRPLLATTRAEILAYLKENKLKFRIDKTNRENIFFRNKIRNQLIPELEKYNPNIKKTIFESVLSIGEDLAFLSEQAEKLCPEKNTFSAKEFLKIHPALQKRILLKIIKRTKGLTNIESSHLNEMIKVIKSQKNKSQKISFQGLKMIRKGDKVTIV